MKKDDHDLMVQNLDLYKLAVRWRSAIRKSKPFIKKIDKHTQDIYWEDQKNGVYPVNWIFGYENRRDANVDRVYDEVKTEVLLIPLDRFYIFIRLLSIAKNRSMQRYRLRKIVNTWFDHNYQVAFVTLNVNNNFLEKKEAVRRKYISKFLSDHCIDYFANVDYSPNTGREHYHACCVLNCKDYIKTFKDEKGIQHYQFDNFPYGFNDIQFVYNPDVSKITDYINKLVNHAIKSSTGQSKNIMRKRKR